MTWHLLGASVTGRAHRARGSGNQDALAAATARDGSLLLAVADGAGSAPRAAAGAQLATETALAVLAAADLSDPETALRLALSKRSEEHTSELQSRGHLVCR